ncbi:MAG TPA: amidase [Candidatus Acidoferrales bacterium]|nr:amidase [Candidatus Acidoferrales bacterium]
MNAIEAVNTMDAIGGDTIFASLAELGAMLRGRKISSAELTKEYLDRLERLGPKYNAVATLTRSLGERQAAAADEKFRRGEIASPLQGIPFGVKDLLATKGIRTTWGSEPYRHQVFDYDATVIEKLRGAGAVLAAKLAMIPLAGGGGYRYSSPHLFGECKNPWNVEYWAGGSSSGPTAAVSAGLAPFAIGSETGGSIVVAAAYTGITAVRPTYGLVSRHGAMALSWTLDKLGPMCHSAEDCGMVLAGIAGNDPKDPSSSGKGFAYPGGAARPMREIRAGYWPADFSESATANARPAFAAALQAFREMGLQMVEIKMPPNPYRQVSGVIAGSECSTVFKPMIEDEARFNQITDPTQKAGLKSGLDIRATEYLQATRARRLIQQQIKEFMTRVDVIVCFTERGSAPRLDSEAPARPAGARGGAGSNPPPSPPGNTDLMAMSNLLGLPGITLPCGFTTDTHLPVALHVAGRPFEDLLLIQIGAEYQRHTKWHLEHPKVG